MEDYHDDDDEEITKVVQPVDIVCERDMLTQAYELSRWWSRVFVCAEQFICYFYKD